MDPLHVPQEEGVSVDRRHTAGNPHVRRGPLVSEENAGIDDEAPGIARTHSDESRGGVRPAARRRGRRNGRVTGGVLGFEPDLVALGGDGLDGDDRVGTRPRQLRPPQ